MAPTYLSSEEIASAVNMRKANIRVVDIAKTLGRSRQSIYDAVNRYANEGRTKASTSPGRPKTLSKRDIRALARYIKQDRTVTLEELVDYLPTKVNKDTVNRYLKEEGFQHKVVRKKPPRKAAQKKKGVMGLYRKHEKLVD